MVGSARTGSSLLLSRQGITQQRYCAPGSAPTECLGPQQYMVIDLESAAQVSSVPLPQDFRQKLRTCSPSALDDGCFTAASDIYLIGQLLEDALLCPSGAAHVFIGLLLDKRLSADQALDHLATEWVLTERMEGRG